MAPGQSEPQATVGPSRGSACSRRNDGLPATEKYSGRTTISAPAADRLVHQGLRRMEVPVAVGSGRRLDGSDTHVTG